MSTSGVIETITRPAKTGGYHPNVMGQQLGIAVDGRSRFTWLEAERMRYDPQIQFGLRILRAPLFGATVKVQADRPAVQAWVDREFGRIYRRMLPRLVRFFEYGVAAGEVTFTARRSRATGKTRVHFDDFHEFHPRDARPLVFEQGRHAGDLAGLHVSNVRGGNLYLDKRHGFFFRGESEYGAWWGRPRMAGPYEPWVEKRGRGGAVDSRRLFYKKGAFAGPRVRYPVGMTDMGSAETGPMLVSNQDIARELAEKFENGGVLALPSVKLPDGTYAWAWEDPHTFADVAGLLDYPKALDKEILIGFGIPPELVDAATVGSGYSGRAIPAQVFFTSMDEVVSLIVEAIDTQILRFLVLLNFGKNTAYEIKPDSLAQLVSQAGTGTPGAGTPGEVMPQPGASGGGAGPMPYQGPRGGIGTRDPVTGRVHYGRPKPGGNSYVRLSLDGTGEDEFDGFESAPDARTLWAESEGALYEEVPAITVWRDPTKAPADYAKNASIRLSHPWEASEHPRGDGGEFAPGGAVADHVAAVQSVADATSDPLAKDYIESALFNHDPDRESPAQLAAALGRSAEASYLAYNRDHVTRSVPPAVRAAIEAALTALGGAPHGPEAGAVTTYDPRLHEVPPAGEHWFTGDAVRVVRQPLLIGNTVVSRGQVANRATEIKMSLRARAERRKRAAQELWERASGPVLTAVADK